MSYNSYSSKSQTKRNDLAQNLCQYYFRSETNTQIGNGLWSQWGQRPSWSWAKTFHSRLATLSTERTALCYPNISHETSISVILIAFCSLTEPVYNLEAEQTERWYTRLLSFNCYNKK